MNVLKKHHTSTQTVCVDSIRNERKLADVGVPPMDADAILSASDIDLESFNSGVAELPDEVLASSETHGISVINGQIIATWKNDGSDLDGVSYIVTPKIEREQVKWSITGTCSRKKAC